MVLARKKLATKYKTDLVNITSEVKQAVEESKVSSGICLISALHTTAAIVVNEPELGLHNDAKRLLSQFLCIPDSEHDKRHGKDNANAQAHLIAMLLGHESVIPVHDGKLVLGKWQQIFFLELDGPRPRDPDGEETYPEREYTIAILQG